MCRTPYCYGDCEECIEEKAEQKKLEDSNALCPHKIECTLLTLNSKQDQCITCNAIFDY